MTKSEKWSIGGNWLQMEEESGRESMGKRGEKSGRVVDILARCLYDKGENGAEESLSVKKRGGEKCKNLMCWTYIPTRW